MLEIGVLSLQQSLFWLKGWDQQLIYRLGQLRQSYLFLRSQHPTHALCFKTGTQTIGLKLGSKFKISGSGV